MSGISIKDGVYDLDTDTSFYFMKEVNEFCLDCRHILDDKCYCLNSGYYGWNVKDENLDFSSCEEKYHEIDSENMRKTDKDTGSPV